MTTIDLALNDAPTTRTRPESVQPPKLSIIVPAYCEAANLELLVDRIHDALAPCGIRWEVIVVDDASPDGTEDVCHELAQRHPLTCIVRRDERGLSSAVIAGMRIAAGEQLVVMDADLSHPPEAIPELLARLREPDVDFVIGSRYVAGGSTADDWGPFRWLNSRVATLLARPLTSARDPMAGFFAIDREKFLECESDLAPLGYKIGLELIVKGNCRRVDEVPIHFSDRLHGESKLTLAEQGKYLWHVARLYRHRYPGLARVLTFGAVGASGILFDLSTFAVLLAAAVPFGAARALAILVAMTWNFTLHRSLTFRDREPQPLLQQYVSFCSACLLGAAANWGVSRWLFTSFEFFASRSLVAAVVGIVAGFAFNFVACSLFVFRKRERNSVVSRVPSRS